MIVSPARTLIKHIVVSMYKLYRFVYNCLIDLWLTMIGLILLFTFPIHRIEHVYRYIKVLSYASHSYVHTGGAYKSYDQKATVCVCECVCVGWCLCMGQQQG